MDPHQRLIAAMVAEWPEADQDAFNERAAIIEFDGKQTRDAANMQACQQMLRKKRK